MEPDSKIKFFEIAKRLSKKSTYCHQLGAVIVKKNRIVGLGFNNPKKTHPRSTNLFKTVHAELAAVLSAGEEVYGADIYIYREHKSGLPANSKPCKFCQKLLEEVGIKNVHYTDEGQFKKYNI